ncbi:hypothetical protein [Nostoc sp. CMAA1605]|nr:hypothetical protein [Nostoc sp. CMAA1605]
MGIGDWGLGTGDWGLGDSMSGFWIGIQFKIQNLKSKIFPLNPYSITS